MKRRDFLKQGIIVSAGLAVVGMPKLTRFVGAQEGPKWRSFEVVTRIEVTDPVGAVRVWVPVPLTTNTDYFKREPDTWTGNFKAVRAVQYDKHGTGLVFAEWAAGEKALLEKIAEMPPADRALAERVHAIVQASAPGLWPKTWYGMPAYAKDGKVLCFFQSADKFNSRYATFGFSDEANRDKGAMGPTSFALKELTAADEAKIAALVKKAGS